MSSLAARSGIRIAPRSLQRGRLPLRNSAVLAQKTFVPQIRRAQQLQPLQTSRAFSVTMAPRAEAAGSTDINDYDPEIQDMAEYIHNYKIDSDLAVRTI